MKWYSISGYEGVYEITRSGRIRSLDRVLKCRHAALGHNLRRYKGRELHPRIQPPGYFVVELNVAGVVNRCMLHRLLASTFIPNPDNLPQVNHKNGIKTDNRLANLEWCTRSYNVQHAYDNGLANGPRGEKNGQAKYTEEKILQIWDLLNTGMMQKDVAIAVNMSRKFVTEIANGKRWSYLTRHLVKTFTTRAEKCFLASESRNLRHRVRPGESERSGAPDRGRDGQDRGRSAAAASAEAVEKIRGGFFPGAEKAFQD